MQPKMHNAYFLSLLLLFFFHKICAHIYKAIAYLWWQSLRYIVINVYTTSLKCISMARFWFRNARGGGLGNNCHSNFGVLFKIKLGNLSKLCLSEATRALIPSRHWVAKGASDFDGSENPYVLSFKFNSESRLKASQISFTVQFLLIISKKSTNL